MLKKGENGSRTDLVLVVLGWHALDANVALLIFLGLHLHDAVEACRELGQLCWERAVESVLALVEWLAHCVHIQPHHGVVPAHLVDKRLQHCRG